MICGKDDPYQLASCNDGVTPWMKRLAKAELDKGMEFPYLTKKNSFWSRVKRAMRSILRPRGR